MPPVARWAALLLGVGLVASTRLAGDVAWTHGVVAAGGAMALLLVPQAWRQTPRPWPARAGAGGLLAAAAVPPAQGAWTASIPSVVVPAAILALLLLALPRQRAVGGRRRLRLPPPRAVLVLAALAAVPLAWRASYSILPDRVASAYELQALLGPLLTAFLVGLVLLGLGWSLRAVQALAEPGVDAEPGAPDPEVNPHARAGA